LLLISLQVAIITLDTTEASRNAAIPAAPDKVSLQQQTYHSRY
jgi:hypothetical protein